MKNSINKEIEQALKFDSLSEAEKVTGKSYKENQYTGMLGMLLQMEHSEIMKNLMDSTDDTNFSESESEYLRKVTDFGFKTLVKIPFFSTSSEQEENFYIMFHYDYSILLYWDTFNGNRNGGKFCYNWSFKNIEDKRDVTSSGGCIHHDKEKSYTAWFNEDLTPHHLPEELRDKEPHWDLGNQKYEDFKVLDKEFQNKIEEYKSDKDLYYIWCGDHDCREALKFNINRMVENGTFLKKWKKKPFMWLLHHMDSKQEGYSYEEINEQRIKMLPEDVQELIKGETNY